MSVFDNGIGLVFDAIASVYISFNFLISGNIKKSIKNIEIAKSKGKNSVFIEKKSGKFQGKGSSSQVSERRHVQKNKNFSSES